MAIIFRNINGNPHAPIDTETGKVVFDKTDINSMSTDVLKEELQRELPEKKPVVKDAEKKMTSAEKIANIHIDFDRDNILPELNEEDLEKIGVKTNKPVLLKKGVIDRNARRHSDAMPDTELILKNALYSPSEVFRGNKGKPYHTFVKPMKVSSRNGLDEYGIVLLDVDEKKDHFEIVHWHWVNEENIERLKK